MQLSPEYVGNRKDGKGWNSWQGAGACSVGNCCTGPQINEIFPV